MTWTKHRELELHPGMRIKTKGAILDVISVGPGGATVKTVERFRFEDGDGGGYYACPDGEYTITKKPSEVELWETGK